MKRLILSSALVLLAALPASAEIDQTIYMDVHGLMAEAEQKPLKVPFSVAHPRWHRTWKIVCGVWKVSVGGAQIAAAFTRRS